MYKLLIVEDDRNLNRGLCKALQDVERKTVSALSLKEAREELSLENVELVILDINLPDGSGLNLLNEIKKRTPETPVILLTANDTDMDVVEGLEKGADDYITKPFALSVLRARVNTQLRRREKNKRESDESRTKYSKGSYIFDFEKMIFMIDGKPTELSKTEQKLLKILVDNKGITLKRENLIDRVWNGGADYVDENALSVTIKRLRDKVDRGNNIKTVYGLGYRWMEDNE